MRSGARFLAVVSVLLISAHRLPAPIVEETPPPSTGEKPQAAAANRKSAESSDANSTRRFDGTWKGTFTEKTAAGTSATSQTLIIKGGKTADATVEANNTLASGKSWDSLPQQYQHLSPLYFKTAWHSDHLTAVGSDLVIRWSGAWVLDWAPKTLPREEAQKLVDLSASKPGLFTLKGDELVGAKFGFHRVR